MVFVISISELGLWVAVSAIVMLMVSEVASPYYGRMNFLLELKKLRMVAIAFGIAFIFIASTEIASIIYK
ncbi:MAG: hypothetical protein ACE5KA_02530 [Nitrososphaerales archaeon]